MKFTVSPEIQYILLVFGLFIVPRALQRFRLPSAITCVGIGAALSIGFHLFHEDSTVKLLATLGIVAMFLFAGLDVDFSELKRGRLVLMQHVGLQLLLLVIGALVIRGVLGLGMRPALLFSLALFTPSTGFILDSLGGFGLSDEERFWVKSKAIASELVALGVLFLTIQSEDIVTLGLSAGVLIGMVALLPPIFRVFARVIVPFAPKTEFTFLVIVALLCAFITRELGVYYLVGAFVVGLTAVQMRKDLPELSSGKLLGGVEFFASFFIPFYFFKAGLHLQAEQFTWKSLGIAGVLLAVVVPARIARVALHRRFALKEPWEVGVRIGTAVIPTLVFTIVITEILQERFGLSPELFGALIVFTLVNTIIPGFALRVAAPLYDAPAVPPVPVAAPLVVAAGTTEPQPEAAAPEEEPAEGRLQDSLVRLLGGSVEGRPLLVEGMLRRDAQEATSHWLRLVISVGIATLGLVVGSSAVVIGAMLCAPLMGPIVGLAMGLATGSPFLVFRSAGRLVFSVVVAVGGAAIITMLLPFHEINAEILARTSPTVLDLITAGVCALIGVYASMRPGSHHVALAAGTPISILLVPPLCASGYGLGTAVWWVAGGAALLFLTNLVAMVVVGTVVFVAAGFTDVDVVSLEHGELQKEGKEGPLAKAFTRRLSRLFDSRWGPVLRFLMPFMLLAAVYVPLRRALDEVAWQVRVRAEVGEAISRETLKVVQSRVRVERHEVEVVMVVLGKTQDAEAARGRIDAEIRRASGVVPRIEILAVPDATAFAGLESTLLTPHNIVAPVASAPSPDEQLGAVRSRIRSVVGEVWPTATAGEPLVIDVDTADDGPLRIQVIHLGLPLSADAAETMRLAIGQRLGRDVRMSGVAVPAVELTRQDGDLALVARVASGLRVTAGVPEVRVCVVRPAEPAAGRKPAAADVALARALDDAFAAHPRVRITSRGPWSVRFSREPCVSGSKGPAPSPGSSGSGAAGAGRRGGASGGQLE
jgi:uncharacterized hydrophobic protein (TIGR00271 family)